MLHLHRFQQNVELPYFPLQRRITILPLKKRFRFLNATIELQRFFFLFYRFNDTNGRRQSSAENNPIPLVSSIHRVNSPTLSPEEEEDDALQEEGRKEGAIESRNLDVHVIGNSSLEILSSVPSARHRPSRCQTLIKHDMDD